MQTLLRILVAVFLPLTVTACMWDAETLSREKSRSHDLAQTILNNQPISEDTNHLRSVIKDLEANRHEDDPMWWNNLAGAHLRLGESATAVKLLEPVVSKFPNDYGIHANLGTAYHLLGRYQDAEKEIARDLEINPAAHFGLEKYHLALLQYLIRDRKYQSRHVYVDEWTTLFLINNEGWNFDPYYGEMEEGDSRTAAQNYKSDAAAEADYQLALGTNGVDGSKTLRMLATMAQRDPAPGYRKDFDLHRDTNFEAGMIYMAQMNPKEPACFTMLGIAAWTKRDYHLTISAFEKAISLGSPQSALLKQKIITLKDFIHQSESQKNAMTIALPVGIMLLLLALYVIRCFFRWLGQPKSASAP
jgi:tetratricopeptide (TPR) repeat protein